MIEGKVRVLERINRPNSPLQRYLQKHIESSIVNATHREIYKAFCISVRALGQPCEYLLVQYLVREADTPVIENRWLERARCQRLLRTLTLGYLSDERRV